MVFLIFLLNLSVNHVKRVVPSLIESSGRFEDEWCIFRKNLLFFQQKSEWFIFVYIPVPSSSLNFLANSVTLIMLIGDLGKYNVFQSCSVCTTPPSSFHVHFTVPIPAGWFSLPPIFATKPAVVSLKVTKISLLFQMRVFAELSQTTKLASV